MKGLKRISEKFQDVMTAITFAEAGDDETAKAILKAGRPQSTRKAGEKNIILKPRLT